MTPSGNVPDMTDGFTEDIARRVRWSRENNGGHPNGAWSTGERLFTALVLNDAVAIADAGYTIVEAVERLESELGGVAPAGAWLRYVQKLAEG